MKNRTKRIKVVVTGATGRMGQMLVQQILADKKSDDPRAQESFALKQLKNLYLWRGNLVDGVISRYVVPRINRHEEIHEGPVLAHARELIHADLDAFKTKITKSDKNLPDGNNLGFYE